MVVGDIMNIADLIISWSWCSGTNSLQPVFHMIKTILDILRIVVPIGLIVMTTFDVMKKVINPDDKDGQKKIMIRAIAALIVFLIPTFIRISFKVIDWGLDKTGTYDENATRLSECWK